MIHMQTCWQVSQFCSIPLWVWTGNVLWTERKAGEHGKHLTLKSKEIFKKAVMSK